MSDATAQEPSLHPLLAAVLFLVLVMKPLGDLGLLPHAEGFFAGLLVAFIASLLGILRGSGWLRWIIPVIGLLAVMHPTVRIGGPRRDLVHPTLQLAKLLRRQETLEFHETFCGPLLTRFYHLVATFSVA